MAEINTIITSNDYISGIFAVNITKKFADIFVEYLRLKL